MNMQKINQEEQGNTILANGVFALDKPSGITSQRAVAAIKRWAQKQTEQKNIKVGHAGTLDPLAQGVLVIAVGRENTKKIDTFVQAQKEYLAEITFGVSSSTDDDEGEKTEHIVKKEPSSEQVQKVVDSFVGKIEQTPPAYSAIKINGQEAYKRMRRGENVEMKSRTVTIDRIDVVSFNYPSLVLRVVCQKGVYIRSLARDIGEKLSTGGYLSNLERTRVGLLTKEEAYSLSFFEK